MFPPNVDPMKLTEEQRWFVAMLVANAPTFESLSRYVAYLQRREEILSRSYEPKMNPDVMNARAKMMGMTLDEYLKHRQDEERIHRESKRDKDLKALDKEFGYTNDEDDTKVSSVMSRYDNILKKLEEETQSVKEQIKETPNIFEMDMSMIPKEPDNAEQV